MTPENRSDRKSLDPPPDGRPPGIGWLCLGVFVLNCLLRALLAWTFPLFYKEACFWEWSRFPAWGYLEHPPMVAWTISAAGWLLGRRSIWAIRSPALLFGTGSLLLIHHLALRLFDDRRVAARALWIALGLPLLNAVGVMMLPDSAMVFFHLLFLCLLAAALRRGKARWWLAAGAALGMLLMSKLMGALTLAGCGLFLATSRRDRRWLGRWQPYAGLGVALLCVAPYLCWNGAHDWPTLRFHLWDRHVKTFGLDPLKTLEFAFEQLANTSVFLAIPLVGAILVPTRRLPEAWRPAWWLLKCQALTVLVFFLLVGSVTQTHPHWTLLAYPAAAIGLAAWSVAVPTGRLARRLKPLIALSVVTLVIGAILAIVATAAFRNIRPAALGEGVGRRVGQAQVRLFGWEELRDRVDAILADLPDGEEATVFTDLYERAAMLSFHRPGPPVVDVSPLVRTRIREGDSPRLYQPWGALTGGGGIFLTGDRPRLDLERDLPALFRSVEELPPFTIDYNREVRVRYRVFRVRGFRRAAGASAP